MQARTCRLLPETDLPPTPPLHASPEDDDGCVPADDDDHMPAPEAPELRTPEFERLPPPRPPTLGARASAAGSHALTSADAFPTDLRFKNDLMPLTTPSAELVELVCVAKWGGSPRELMRELMLELMLVTAAEMSLSST